VSLEQSNTCLPKRQGLKPSNISIDPVTAGLLANQWLHGRSQASVSSALALSELYDPMILPDYVTNPLRGRYSFSIYKPINTIL
jgi:hypothetical protein